MRPKENYTPHFAVAFGLTLAIFASFQFYIFREPSRIAVDEKRDRLIAVSLGRILYAENCVMCHGEDGEGVDGPALNDSVFLGETTDDRIFDLIASGVPGTEMPAWGQARGGPFTDEQMRQLTAFIRNWEPEAPDRHAIAMRGDPVNGLVIFNDTCVVCHGESGQGTERAPALNNRERLSQFDDEWYVDTISAGRPAQGMPTWGTVLAPVQIRDLVSLLRAWGRGETVSLPGPEVALAEAVHMFGHGDMHAAEHALMDAAEVASGELLNVLNEAIEAAEAGDANALEEALHEAQELLGMHDEGGHDH